MTPSDGQAGRIDVPAAPVDRVRLPSDLGRRFLVFVDTEEEFDWTAPRRREATATTAIAALPAAHRRLAAFGIAPIYLIDYPVAASYEAVALLRPLMEAGECEIGTQLHPWVNPPHDEAMTVANSFVGNLPESLERAKLASLTERIAEGFGRRPTVYRAGRYGIGANSARLLEEAGYRLDTSVRVTFDYSAEGGPDFTRHDPAPSWAGPGRLLMELPLTSGFTGRGRRLGAAAYAAAGRVPRLRGLLARAGIMQRVALTPEGTPLADALALVRAMIEADARLLSISFHSPSVEPGHTPYVRDGDDLRRFWGWWDGVLDLLVREGFRPIGTEALVAAAWRTRDVGLRLATGLTPTYAGGTGGL